jgi:hypothetical protein
MYDAVCCITADGVQHVMASFARLGGALKIKH